MNKMNVYGTVFAFSKIATDLAIALGISMVNQTLGWVTIAIMTTARISLYLYQDAAIKEREVEYARQTAELNSLLSMMTVNKEDETTEDKENVTLQ